jgi:hypothetical protein
MKARIYRPARTAMQSGTAKTKRWLLEYEATTPRRPEPLMGWVSSGDTLNQVRLSFPTKDEAVAYAEKQGLEYTVSEPHNRQIKPNNYVMNFKPDLVRTN